MVSIRRGQKRGCEGARVGVNAGVEIADDGLGWLVGGRGQFAQASQSWDLTAPRAIDLALKRVDPNGPFWKRVKARILLAGGWEMMAPNQWSSQVVVGVDGQSGGTQRDQEAGASMATASRQSSGPRNQTGCGVDPEIQALLEAGAVLFRGHEKYHGGGLMTCCPRRRAVARARARQQQQ